MAESNLSADAALDLTSDRRMGPSPKPVVEREPNVEQLYSPHEDLTNNTDEGQSAANGRVYADDPGINHSYESGLATLEEDEDADDDDPGGWQPDDEKNECNCCHKPFRSVVRRRHHCRKCCLLVCNRCSRSRRLDRATDKFIRICDDCVKNSGETVLEIYHRLEGVTLTRRDGGVYLTNVPSQSKSYDAGLRDWCRIIAINRQNVETRDVQFISHRLKRVRIPWSLRVAFLEDDDMFDIGPDTIDAPRTRRYSEHIGSHHRTEHTTPKSAGFALDSDSSPMRRTTRERSHSVGDSPAAHIPRNRGMQPSTQLDDTSPHTDHRTLSNPPPSSEVRDESGNLPPPPKRRASRNERVSVDVLEGARDDYKAREDAPGKVRERQEIWRIMTMTSFSRDQGREFGVRFDERPFGIRLEFGDGTHSYTDLQERVSHGEIQTNDIIAAAQRTAVWGWYCACDVNGIPFGSRLIAVNGNLVAGRSERTVAKMVKSSELPTHMIFERPRRLLLVEGTPGLRSSGLALWRILGWWIENGGWLVFIFATIFTIFASWRNFLWFVWPFVVMAPRLVYSLGGYGLMSFVVDGCEFFAHEFRPRYQFNMDHDFEAEDPHEDFYLVYAQRDRDKLTSRRRLGRSRQSIQAINTAGATGRSAQMTERINQLSVEPWTRKSHGGDASIEEPSDVSSFDDVVITHAANPSTPVSSLFMSPPSARRRPRRASESSNDGQDDEPIMESEMLDEKEREAEQMREEERKQAWMNLIEPEGTRDWGGYNSGNASKVSVRSDTYLEDQVKEPSEPMLLKLCRTDVFVSKEKINHIACHPQSWFAQNAHLLPRDSLVVIIHLQLQSINTCLTSYYLLPGGLKGGTGCTAMDETKLFETFVNGDCDFRRKRFKLFALAVDGPVYFKYLVPHRPAILGRSVPLLFFRGIHGPNREDSRSSDSDTASTSVSWMERSTSASHLFGLNASGSSNRVIGNGLPRDRLRNFRSRLIKHAIPSNCKSCDESSKEETCKWFQIADDMPQYFEIDVEADQHPLASRIVSLAHGVSKKLVVEMHWLLEGQTVRELPERIFASVQLHHVDLKRAEELRDPDE